MKTLNNLLLVFTVLLLILSAFVIVLIQVKALQYNFSLTITSVEFYLSMYGDYKGLFTITIASVATLSGLKSLNESINANKEKIKQDRFNEWKNGLDVRLSEISQDDQIILKIFIQRRHRLFRILYDYNFEIKDIACLMKIFQVFADVTPIFETENGRYKKLKGIYQDRDHSYTFEAFCNTLFGGVDKCYEDTKRDLKQMYMKSLPEERTVDFKAYMKSLEETWSPLVY